MKYFILALIVITALATTQCPAYVCKPLVPDACALRTIGENGLEIHLHACKDRQYCNYPANLDELGMCGNLTDYPYMLPGEFCGVHENCISKNCTNHKCLGKGENEPCDASIFCNPGLYCNSTKFCVPTAKIGDHCNSTIECTILATCVNEKCEKIGGVENGNPAPVPAMCKSFYILNGNCSAGPKLKLKESNCADPKIQCKYDVGENQPCVCGMTNKSLPVCKPGIGDAKVEDFLTFLNPDRAKDCNIARGVFSLTKSDLTIDYARAYKAYILMTQGAITVDNEECVKKSISKMYWDAVAKVDAEDVEDEDQFGLYLFLGIAIGAVFVIAILLLVIYFKRRKSDDDDTEGKDKLATTS